MKVADSPEMAVRFGSASVRTTPALSIARIVAVTDAEILNDAVDRRWCATSGRPYAVNGIAVVEIHDRGAVIHAAGEIDAELLDDVAPHFGDGDLQHHLVAAADRDRS